MRTSLQYCVILLAEIYPQVYRSIYANFSHRGQQMVNVIHLDFGHGLNLKRAEDAISKLGCDREGYSTVYIDLSNCKHVDLGAGWRLGCTLRRFKAHGKII